MQRNVLHKIPLPWLVSVLLLVGLFLLMTIGHWRAAGVGPQVQVPMFYDAHYLFPRPWVQAQEAPGVPPPAPVAALYGSNQVSQSFMVGSGRLSLLRLWLAGPADELVRVVLDNGVGDVWQGEIGLEDENGRFYTLSLPTTQTTTQSQRWTVTLTAPQASQSAPVITRAVGGDRLGGAIHLNEYSRPGNLELYTYAQGWPGRWWIQAISEQILPATFALRVQQYKPDPFKGAAFPALLFVTVGLTLLFLVLARPTTTSFSQATGWTTAAMLAAFLLWQLGGQRLLLFPAHHTLQVASSSDYLLVGEMGAQSERLVHDFSLTKWTARRLPEERLVTTDWVDNKPAIRVPADSSLNYALTMPLNGRFYTQIATDGPGELHFSVQWADQEIAAQTVTHTDGPVWFEVDLSPWAGQESHLKLVTRPLVGEPDGLWFWPQLTADHNWVQPVGQAQPPDQLVDALFADQVRLLGYDLPETAVAGDLLPLTFYWQAITPLADHANLFIHLVDEADQIIAQQDGPPVAGTYPLPTWPTDHMIIDQRWLYLPETAVAGTYQIAIGLYDPVTLIRWPATTQTGEPLPDSRLLLEQQLTIIDPTN